MSESEYRARAQSCTDAQLLTAISCMEAEEGGAFGMDCDHSEQLEVYYNEASARGLLHDEEEVDGSVS